MLNLTTWPLSLQVIMLLSDKNQFVFQYLTLLMVFCMQLFNEPPFVILCDGLYIYRYNFSIFQYTFIGWVWGGAAAHLYQVHARDTPPPPRSNISLYKNIVFIAVAQALWLLWQLKVSIDLKWEKWKMRFIVISLQIFWQKFYRSVCWVVSTKHIILVQTSQFDWLPWHG